MATVIETVLADCQFAARLAMALPKPERAAFMNGALTAILARVTGVDDARIMQIIEGIY